MRVLVIDDDVDWCRNLAFLLEQEDFEVVTESVAGRALSRVDEVKPSIVILDLSLGDPDIDGFDIARRLNERLELKGNSFRLILVSGAFKSNSHKRFGFSIGADDYWTKPFQTSLLTSYLVNCRNRMNPSYSRLIELGSDAYIDPQNSIFCIDGKSIDLTPLENDFLTYLASDHMSRKSRKQIETNVWKEKVVEDAAIHTCVSVLRKKLGSVGKNYIETKHGQGYRLKPASQHNHNVDREN